MACGAIVSQISFKVSVKSTLSSLVTGLANLQLLLLIGEALSYSNKGGQGSQLSPEHLQCWLQNEQQLYPGSSGFTVVQVLVCCCTYTCIRLHHRFHLFLLMAKLLTIVDYKCMTWKTISSSMTGLLVQVKRVVCRAPVDNVANNGEVHTHTNSCRSHCNSYFALAFK